MSTTAFSVLEFTPQAADIVSSLRNSQPDSRPGTFCSADVEIENSWWTAWVKKASHRARMVWSTVERSDLF